MAPPPRGEWNSFQPPGGGRTNGEAQMKRIVRRGAALFAAAATTLVLFSGVASLADSDRATLLAAQLAPATMAVYTGAWARR